MRFFAFAFFSLCSFSGSDGSLFQDLLTTRDDFVPIFEVLINTIRNDSRAFDQVFRGYGVDTSGFETVATIFNPTRFEGLDSLTWPRQVTVTRKGNHVSHVRSRWSINAPMIQGLLTVSSSSHGSQKMSQNMSLIYPTDLSFVIVLYINSQYQKVGVTVAADTSDTKSQLNRQFTPIIEWTKGADDRLQHSSDYAVRTGVIPVERLASAFKTRIALLIR